MKEKIQTAIAYGQSKEIGIYALASAVNGLLAAGAETCSVSVRILVPSYAFKSRLNTMEKVIKSYCQKWDISLSDIKSEKHVAVNQSMVVVTACAYVEDKVEAYAPGQEIVMTKWMGLEGMLRIVEEKEEVLKERFAPGFIRQMKSYKENVFAKEEITIARAENVSAIRQITEGGMLAALWDLAKEAEMGLEVELKNFQIRQETIEVCELFHLNPYQLASAGTMLMITDDGEALTEELQKNGIPAAVIGRFTDNNDKIIRNGEEIRYIDRPAPDELMKIFEEQT